MSSTLLVWADDDCSLSAYGYSNLKNYLYMCRSSCIVKQGYTNRESEASVFIQSRGSSVSQDYRQRCAWILRNQFCHRHSDRSKASSYLLIAEVVRQVDYCLISQPRKWKLGQASYQPLSLACERVHRWRCSHHHPYRKRWMQLTKKLAFFGKNAIVEVAKVSLIILQDWKF